MCFYCHVGRLISPIESVSRSSYRISEYSKLTPKLIFNDNFIALKAFKLVISESNHESFQKDFVMTLRKANELTLPTDLYV